MTRKTYKIKLPFDVLHVSADLEQASAPIIIIDDAGQEIATPLQTANAQHRADRLAVLAVQQMGTEYWKDPDADYTSIDDADAIADMIVSVTEE